ncbi:MAG: hypothetical protein ACLSGB_09575 [Dorea sp.]
MKNQPYLHEYSRKKEIMEAVFQAGLPIGSMSVSALTKYALGDPDEEIRRKQCRLQRNP